jgi:hypothetical protein
MRATRYCRVLRVDRDAGNDGALRHFGSGARLILACIRQSGPFRFPDLTGSRLCANWGAAVDDAFPDPFLLVRPTGTPWNDAFNQQALRTLGHFNKRWAKFFRAHPLVKEDRDVTAANLARYHVVLFGDSGSNRLIAKFQGKLPLQWTRETVVLGGQTYPAKEHFPAMIYPNPLSPTKYVVLNTGLTITDREYNGDYGLPQWGDYAIVKVRDGANVPGLGDGRPVRRKLENFPGAELAIRVYRSAKQRC